jgi:hypothetical protein
LLASDLMTALGDCPRRGREGGLRVRAVREEV